MGFAPPSSITRNAASCHLAVHPHSNLNFNHLNANSHGLTALFMTSEEQDPNETVARRVIVVGDVNGGYYRTCVINEVSFCVFICSRDCALLLNCLLIFFIGGLSN
jgi:hypothetical protein